MKRRIPPWSLLLVGLSLALVGVGATEGLAKTQKEVAQPSLPRGLFSLFGGGDEDRSDSIEENKSLDNATAEEIKGESTGPEMENDLLDAINHLEEKDNSGSDSTEENDAEEQSELDEVLPERVSPSRAFNSTTRSNSISISISDSNEEPDAKTNDDMDTIATTSAVDLAASDVKPISLSEELIPEFNEESEAAQLILKEMEEEEEEEELEEEREKEGLVEATSTGSSGSPEDPSLASNRTTVSSSTLSKSSPKSETFDLEEEKEEMIAEWDKILAAEDMDAKLAQQGKDEKATDGQDKQEKSDAEKWEEHILDCFRDLANADTNRDDFLTAHEYAEFCNLYSNRIFVSQDVLKTRPRWRLDSLFEELILEDRFGDSRERVNIYGVRFETLEGLSHQQNGYLQRICTQTEQILRQIGPKQAYEDDRSPENCDLHKKVQTGVGGGTITYHGTQPPSEDNSNDSTEPEGEEEEGRTGGLLNTINGFFFGSGSGSDSSNNSNSTSSSEDDPEGAEEENSLDEKAGEGGHRLLSSSDYHNHHHHHDDENEDNDNDEDKGEDEDGNEDEEDGSDSIWGEDRTMDEATKQLYEEEKNESTAHYETKDGDTTMVQNEYPLSGVLDVIGGIYSFYTGDDSSGTVIGTDEDDKDKEVAKYENEENEGKEDKDDKDDKDEHGKREEDKAYEGEEDEEEDNGEDEEEIGEEKTGSHHSGSHHSGSNHHSSNHSSSSSDDSGGSVSSDGSSGSTSSSNKRGRNLYLRGAHDSE